MSDKIINNETEFEDIDIDIDDLDNIDRLVDEEVSLKELEAKSKVETSDSEEVTDKISDELDISVGPDISDDLDIKAIIDEVVDETPRKKRVNKIKADQNKSEQVKPEQVKPEQVKPEQVKPEAEPESAGKSYYNPEFDVAKIKTNKYQTRQTKRTIEDIESLCEKIKFQGVLVPVQLVKEGDEYQLVDGFGRLEAVKTLGIPKIKAIIHEGLPYSEIIKIGTGANIGRTELSDWDKIYSVGKFYEENLDKYKKEELCKIFGHSKSVLYSYLEIYEVFKDDQFLTSMFQKVKIPFFFFSIIRKYLKQYPLVNLKDLHDFIKAKSNNTFINKESFDNSLNELCQKITKNNTSDDVEDEIEIDVSDIKNIDDKKISEEILNPPESMDVKVKIVIEQYVDNIIKCFKKIEENMKGITSISKFKEYIDSKSITMIKEKIEKLKKNIFDLV